MDEILSELSFDEGIAMPVANEENKKLEISVSTVYISIYQVFIFLIKKDKILKRIFLIIVSTS